MSSPASDVSRELEFVARGVRSQECILFLGAGVHAAPPDDSPFRYPVEQRPPIGSALSRDLALACGFAQQLPHELRQLRDYADTRRRRFRGRSW